MRILYLDWPCFGKVDTQFSLEQAGHEFVPFFHPDYQERVSADFDNAFSQFVGDTYYDCCFSFNYFPVVSNNCQKFGITYISVIYDSPYLMLYSYTLINPVNYVFMFDKQEYLRLKNGGISTVYYTVLPCNSTIIDFLLTKPYDHEKLSAEVSFVGSLYNEDHNFFDRLTTINDYTRGYLDAIMEAQLKVYGYNFIEDLLSDDILAELQRSVPYDTISSGVEAPSYVYANYFIDRKLTSIERQRLLTAVASTHPLKVYTLDRNAIIPNAKNMGPVDYYSEMPYVFANSKINLNISLRSIQSGIPLRAMDIMGAGGFLLTNFQSDFLDYFIPNEDFVYFDSKDDLCQKIDYYLSHESERQEIAFNGHEKVKYNHNFDIFFQHIFSIVFP
ncbi:DUF3880 domain-containing protein [bacterium]|nr:DUF3880 domain-containing protein [bacterium]